MDLKFASSGWPPMCAQSQNNHWHFMLNVSGFHCCIETKQPSMLDSSQWTRHKLGIWMRNFSVNSKMHLQCYYFCLPLQLLFQTNFPSEKRTRNLHKKLRCSLKVEIGLPLFDLWWIRLWSLHKLNIPQMQDGSYNSKYCFLCIQNQWRSTVKTTTGTSSRHKIKLWYSMPANYQETSRFLFS
jgi:hypothetical protein